MLAQSSENCFLGVSQTGNAGPSYWSKTVPERMTSPQTWSPFSSSWLSSSATGALVWLRAFTRSSKTFDLLRFYPSALSLVTSGSCGREWVRQGGKEQKAPEDGGHQPTQRLC